MPTTPKAPIVWHATSDTVPPSGVEFCRNQETLVRNRAGRIQLPPWDLIDPNNVTYPYTERELDELHAETMRRRFRWRAINYVRLACVLAFLYLTFFSLPILLLRS